MRHCFLFLFFFPINFSFVGNFKITGFIPNQSKTKCQNFPRTRNLIIWPVFLVIIHIFFQLNWMCCLMSMSSLNFYIASNGSLSTFWTEINCHSACLQLLVGKGTSTTWNGGKSSPKGVSPVLGEATTAWHTESSEKGVSLVLKTHWGTGWDAMYHTPCLNLIKQYYKIANSE